MIRYLITTQAKRNLMPLGFEGNQENLSLRSENGIGARRLAYFSLPSQDGGTGCSSLSRFGMSMWHPHTGE